MGKEGLVAILGLIDNYLCELETATVPEFRQGAEWMAHARDVLDSRDT